MKCLCGYEGDDFIDVTDNSELNEIYSCTDKIKIYRCPECGKEDVVNESAVCMTELKELLKPPFAVIKLNHIKDRGNTSLFLMTEIHGQKNCEALYEKMLDWITAAMNEKYERDFAEPLKWILKEWKPFDNRLAVICPKCDSPFEYHAIEFSNYCPHCGQKLDPPERKE